MTHFCMTTRKEKNRRFKPSLGEAQFLIAESNDERFHPDRVINKDEWLNKIKNGGNKNIVLFVHGHNINAKHALKQHKDIEYGLGNNGSENFILISFDWPAIGRFWGYDQNKSNACDSSDDLIDLIDLLKSEYPESKIHIIAHSMGCFLTFDAISEYGESLDKQPINKIIFMAADLPQNTLEKDDDMAEDMANDFFNRLEHFTNYYHPNDAVLDVSNFTNNNDNKWLGAHGVPPEVLENHTNKITNVDASQWFNHHDNIKYLKAHSDYFKCDKLFGDIAKEIKK